jgi:hypothetical protein
MLDRVGSPLPPRSWAWLPARLLDRGKATVEASLWIALFWEWLYSLKLWGRRLLVAENPPPREANAEAGRGGPWKGADSSILRLILARRLSFRG